MMLSQGRTVATRRLLHAAGRSLSTLQFPQSTPFQEGTHRIVHISTESFFVRHRFLSTAVEKVDEPVEASKETKKPFVPTPDRKYEFFQNLEITEDGVAVVRFDCLGKSVNTISFALAEEAKTFWNQEIENNDSIKAVVFTSAKKDSFIVGADIYDIQKTENKQDLIPIIEDGLKLFQKMKAKGVPLVAAIDGPALGGGLEWALWCDYRICTDSSKTKVRSSYRCSTRPTF